MRQSRELGIQDGESASGLGDASRLAGTRDANS